MAWKRHLPGAIDGVFYFGGDDSRAHATDVRDAFAAEFALSKQQVPVLRMAVHGNELSGARPFSPG